MDEKSQEQAWETVYYMVLFAIPTAAVNLWMYLRVLLSGYFRITKTLNLQPTIGVIFSGLWIIFSALSVLVYYLGVERRT
jgi:hypothetical protein